MPHVAFAPRSNVRTFFCYGCQRSFKTEPGGRTRVCGTSGFTAALVVLRPLRTTCACWALLVLPVCINASAVVSLKFRSHIHADGARKCYTHTLRESCACPSTHRKGGRYERKAAGDAARTCYNAATHKCNESCTAACELDRLTVAHNAAHSFSTEQRC